MTPLEQGPPQFTRREFFALSGLLAAAELLASCSQKEEALFSLLQKELEFSKYDGNVYNTQSGLYVVRNRRGYHIPDFEKYKKGTDFDLHKRTVISSELPHNVFIAEFKEKPTVPDLVTGEDKNHNRDSKMLILCTGLSDTSGLSPTPVKKGTYTIDALGTFNKLVNQRILKDGWSFDDCLRLMYGTIGSNTYDLADTLEDPIKVIQKMNEQMKLYKAQFPRTQFILAGFSMGALYTAIMCMLHPDAINGAVMIEGPIRGAPDEGVVALEQLFRQNDNQIPDVFISQNKISPFLKYLWGSNDYKNMLINTDKRFEREQKPFVAVTLDTDPIVKRNWSVVPGGKEMALHKVASSSPLANHGPGVWDDGVVNYIASLLGKNPNA